MQIQSFSLKHIGQFQDININIAPTDQYSSNITVFIGNNGSGKTSLLKSIATSLTWFVARLKHDKSSGTLIPETVISNNKNSAMIELAVDVLKLMGKHETYTWRITKSRTARKSEFHSEYTELTRLTDHYKELLTTSDKSSLPLVAFYPVQRSVIDIPLKIREKHQFLQINGYDNSLNNAVDFRRFFEWFRDREDAENEMTKNAKNNFFDNSAELNNILIDLDGFEKRIDELVIDDFDKFRKEVEKLKKALAFQKEYESISVVDPQLQAVREAIYRFIPEFNNLCVKRKPRLHMSVKKNGKPFNVIQLSQGEKTLMALVGDIARRLAMMNPGLDNPLHGQGVILIDEIDLHLHPQWQRVIISRLQETFPNCQFILTTHSPLVISDAKNILVYELDEQDIKLLPSLYGQDANTVLLQYMDTNYRNFEVNKQITEAIDTIQNNNLEKAAELIQILKSELGNNNLEVMRLIAMLKKRTLMMNRH